MSEYGYIRQLNKRKNEGPKPRPGETVIDVDRNSRVLGNPFSLEDKDDEVARTRVIVLYNEKLEADFAIGGSHVHSREGYCSPGHRWRENRVKLLVCPLCLSFGHHRKENCGDGSRGAA
jgi:hypothetical protein